LDHGRDVEAPAEGELMAATHASEKARWESDGWCLLDALLPDDVVRAAQAELPALFPTAGEFAADRDPERNRPFRTTPTPSCPAFPSRPARSTTWSCTTA